MVEEPDQNIFKQRQQLQDMAHCYRKSQILLTCVELGVFDSLTKGSKFAAEVAADIGVDAHAAELLFNAAAAIGLLEKRENCYRNSELAETHLTQNAAGNMARRLKLEGAFYRRWGRLIDAVRTGRRPEENCSDEQPEDWVRTFIYGLYDTARTIAPVIAELLCLPEDQPLRVLDIGGGHGGYCIALAQRYPLLTATVFELPRVVPVAREIIAQAGLQERIAVQEGDFHQDTLGSGYDAALIFGVLNGEPREDKPVLFRKVFSALNPGGQIVLREFVLGPDRASPPQAAIFALQMLLTTEAGGLDTSDDWAEWLVLAGFALPQQIELPPWIGSSLTIARKPSTQ